MRNRRGAMLVGVALLTGLAASPASGARFAVKGDWGSGFASQTAISNRMCAEYDRAKFDFVLTTGDNFYPSGTATPATWGRPERCLRQRGLRYRAAWGNHDVGGSSTATVLKSPNRWYTFLAGPARIVVLDANQPSSRDQLRFLERVLSTETTRPVIVAYHQGTRTVGLHPPQLVQQQKWEPLFLKYKVRLALQGHNHSYERIVYKGLTYVTSGGGGYSTYPCVRKTAGLVMCKSVNHFLTVDVTTDAIDVTAIDAKGKVIDRFEIPLTAT